MPKQAIQFLTKGVLLLTAFFLITVGLNFVFVRTVDWRKWQDPRKRLFWDGVDRNADVYIVGDSVFISGYVNRETDTLWNLLQELSGRRVSNCTLDGADTVDFLKVGKLLAEYDGTGKTVVLDVIPTRFVPNKIPLANTGNYPTEFDRRMGDSAVGKSLASLFRPLTILDVDVLMNLAKRKQFFDTDDYRDVVWTNDGGRAIKRFAGFEKYWLETDQLKSFEFIDQFDSLLKARGYTLLIVLTPLNSDLVQQNARLHSSQTYQDRLAVVHEALVGYLSAKKIAYVDTYGKFRSEEFSDMMHLNARGDRHMAESIAAHLKAAAADRRRVSTSDHGTNQTPTPGRHFGTQDSPIQAN